MSEARHILGIDIGGTFTDVLAVDVETGGLSVAKVPTVPGSLVDGIVAGVEELGLELGAVSRIVHGSTTCTNALIEGKQARTGFIGTRGFSDEFDIQRMARRWAKTPRAAIYDLHQVKPAPFVPRRLRREVDERTLFSGEIVEPLDAGQLDEAARTLIAHGAEAIAICFLWSPVNDSHERAGEGAARESRTQRVRLDLDRGRPGDPRVRAHGHDGRECVAPARARRIPAKRGRAAARPRLSRPTPAHAVPRRGERPRTGSATSRCSRSAAGPSAVLLRRRSWLAGWSRPRVISCDIGGTSCDTALVLDYEVPMTDGTEVD